jgi:F-box protein 11
MIGVVIGTQLVKDERVCVMVHDKGLGQLEDNDITANARAGVVIRSGGNPTLRRNMIHDGRRSGIYIYNHGLGVVEGNDITENGLAGIEVSSGGRPVVRGNRIHRNAYRALWIYHGGEGVYEDNVLNGNAQGDWSIEGAAQTGLTQSNNQE